MDKSFFSIYKTFFKVGTLLLGGGYVILPLLTSELSDKKGWVTSEELCEFYAISTSLPGIIAVNTAIFTGRKMAGFKGEIAAITGVITPAFIAIILLASILEDIVNFNIIKYLFWGVGIGIITLLFLAVKEMWNKCIVDKYTVVIYSVALLVALFTKISPAWVIIGAILSGLICQKIVNVRSAKNVE
jgi:chromate transporter